MAKPKRLIITAATVVVGNGSDKVYLESNLPCGIYSFQGTQRLVADIIHGGGERWVKENFAIQPNVVKISS